MWCKSLTLEKYISFRMKWFFAPPFLSVSSFLLLNMVRRQCHAYAIGLYTRPEIKSWPDVKFCAHAQCVLPRCCCAWRWLKIMSPSTGSEITRPLATREITPKIGHWAPCFQVDSLSARFKPWYTAGPTLLSRLPSIHVKNSYFLPYKSWTSNFLGCFKLERPLLVSWPYFKNLLSIR